ncbi:MAG: hypothetical protein ACH34Y_02540 [Brachymonas sp.]
MITTITLLESARAIQISGLLGTGLDDFWAAVQEYQGARKRLRKTPKTRATQAGFAA